MTARHEQIKIEKRTRKLNRRIVGWGILAVVGGILILQLIPYGRNHANPPVIQEPNWDSSTTRALAVRACYDCHSNQTVWPWYSNIAPLSMTLWEDTIQGRAAMNFSEWDSAAWDDADTERLIELVGGNHMPPPHYGILHPEARLNRVEQGQLINGLIATITAGD